jgi:hypothetical protein
MLLIFKSHAAVQGMSRAAKPADRIEGDTMINPGEPTSAQSDAGRYNKPRVEWQGLTIAIENPAGSVRRGRDRDGKPWEVRMLYAYGEILGTTGVDGDPVDVFLGPDMDAPTVYVVHQRKMGQWKEYDEDKCMLGFSSESDAVSAFLACYSDPRFLGPVAAMPVAEFLTKVRSTRDAPAMIKAAPGYDFGSADIAKAHVETYTKKDGTVVQAHEDKRQAAAPAQVKPAAARSAQDTPEFRKWFGDSKVVDSDGKPLVVYHGSVSSFQAFDPEKLGTATGAKSAVGGFFFTNDKATANSYGSEGVRRLRKANQSLVAARKQIKDLTGDSWAVAGSRLFQGKYDDRPNIHAIERAFQRAQAAERVVEEQTDPDSANHDPARGGILHDVYLSLQNPLEHDQDGEEHRDVAFSDLIKQAKDGGHDGLIIRNTYDPGLEGGDVEETHDVYVAFAPGQIKSATRNGGGYDFGSPDITKAHVDTYTKKDGTVVEAHEDRRQSLHDDLGRQERWLQTKARGLGHKDIEELLEKDYPAFERLAMQWRENNPVEVSMKSLVLFFKGHVGAYLRNGKMVNTSGYQGRSAHASVASGQMSLFGGPSSGKPLPPSPLQGKDAVAHTPDMFAGDREPVPAVDAGVSKPAASSDPAAELRATWDAAGVPKERQDQLLAQINGKAAPGAKVGPFEVAKPSPGNGDGHPAPMPRSVLSSIPEDRREEWKDLHRQQHETHHYDLGQVREKMDRLGSKKNAALAALRESEGATQRLRLAPIRDYERESESQKWESKLHSNFAKLARDHDGLVSQHQSLYERVAKLGRAKESISPGTGDMDRDFASMERRTPEDQRLHEKSMLKMYRDHYKEKDAELKRKPQTLAKSLVFIRVPKG